MTAKGPTLAERQAALKAAKGKPEKPKDSEIAGLADFELPYKAGENGAPAPRIVGKEKVVEIRVRVKGEKRVKIDELFDLQGDFKTLSPENEAALRTELFELGLCEPLTVCKRTKGGFWILNGHQRLKVLRACFKEGVKSFDIPVNVAPDVEDGKEATRICLALTSQYGQIQKSGLKKMLREARLSVEQAQERFIFPELDLASLDNIEKPEKEKKSKKESADGSARVKKVECPACGHKFEVSA